MKTNLERMDYFQYLIWKWQTYDRKIDRYRKMIECGNPNSDKIWYRLTYMKIEREFIRQVVEDMMAMNKKLRDNNLI